MLNSIQLFDRRKRRIRFQLRRTAAAGVMRLSVHRSNNNIYAQVIDDAAGRTILSASSLEKGFDKKGKRGLTTEMAGVVGALLAERCKKAKVETVYFDRGGYLYHGRVKALAEAARNGGLKF
jgi:large subunit ribosomal protein L18